MVDNPLLSYIDVRHAHFLPPSLTIREAWDLTPRYTTVEDHALVRDESTKCVSQSRKTHIPVEGPDAPVQVAEPMAAESANPSKAEADLGEEMVTRRTLNIDRFLLSTCPVAQSQKTPSKEWTLPPPSSRAKKKQRVSDQPPKVPGDAPVRTPPRASGGFTTQEPAGIT